MAAGVISLLIVTLLLAAGMHSVRGSIWEKPGCHKVGESPLVQSPFLTFEVTTFPSFRSLASHVAGHTRTVSIPDCVKFQITTNACRGFCVSYSIPSDAAVLGVNSNQLVTSVGQCCNILESQDVSSLPFSSV